MSEPETDLIQEQGLQDTAISWYVRVRNPELPKQEHRAFLKWLSADARHREAFAQIEKLWGQLDAPARLLGGNGWYRARPVNRWIAWASAAACLLMAVMVGWHNPGMLQRMQADFATRPGEQLQVVLADGSKAFLDGDSALSFHMENGKRQAGLLRGRVWFDVKRDETRPFSVQQGDLEVRVLGTSFSVDTYGSTRQVAVESGQVNIFWQEQLLVPQILVAGDQLRFHPGKQAGLAKGDLDALSAWRRGLLVFDQAPLADVASTMESVLGKRILVSPALVDMKVTGVFQSANPAVMLDGLASSSGLKILNIPGIGLYLYD